ncbi:LysR substrate-binding domain-containing protein, partial [Bordetella pertussis]
PADTVVHPWRQDEVVAIVRSDHTLAGNGAATLRDLAAWPQVTREPGSGVRGLVE